MGAPLQDASTRSRDDLWAVVAIATLAYISAAIAHEVFGHGVAFYLAGGRQGIFTTTRLITDQQIGRFGGRVFDLGGPIGNLLVALVAWTLLRVLGKAGPALRLFLILSTGLICSGPRGICFFPECWDAGIGWRWRSDRIWNGRYA